MTLFNHRVSLFSLFPDDLSTGELGIEINHYHCVEGQFIVLYLIVFFFFNETGVVVLTISPFNTPGWPVQKTDGS